MVGGFFQVWQNGLYQIKFNTNDIYYSRESQLCEVTNGKQKLERSWILEETNSTSKIYVLLFIYFWSEAILCIVWSKTSKIKLETCHIIFLKDQRTEIKTARATES